jgi:hypothetical protein
VPFFTLIQHTIDAKLTPASFMDSLVNANSIDECFAALGVTARV